MEFKVKEQKEDNKVPKEPIKQEYTKEDAPKIEV